ncbi:hypothetical protein VCHC02A1_0973, partial [Vibrio cholerae HC-02A1]
MAGGKG